MVDGLPPAISYGSSNGVLFLENCAVCIYVFSSRVRSRFLFFRRLWMHCRIQLGQLRCVHYDVFICMRGRVVCAGIVFCGYVVAIGVFGFWTIVLCVYLFLRRA